LNKNSGSSQHGVETIARFEIKLKELTLINQRVTGNGDSSKEATVSTPGTL
jgi:hypothetical protein